MLEYLRNAAEKPVAKILIAILAFSFVGWGVAEWIFSNVGGNNSLVYVGDADVSVPEFNAERSRELAQKSREEQHAIYTDAATQAAFMQSVMTKLATQRMVENRANDLGFVVSDHRIAREIREFPEFMVNGEFSPFAFDSVLNNSGYTEADFAAVLRNQVLRSMVLGAMSAPIPVPEFAARATYNARYGERQIDYATVNFSDFKVSAPSDDQLSEYYAQNPKMIPESRNLSYVFIAADMSKPDDYDRGYAIAVKVEDDIIAGDAMRDTAKKHDAKYVELGGISIEKRPVDKVLTDKMFARVFDMDEGLESEMIETKDGFLIMRVDKINPAHKAEFADIKKSLVSDWTRAEQKKQAYVRANEILVDLNKDGKMPGKKSVTVSRAKGAPAQVLSAAFNNAVETNTLVPGTDAFYVVRINKDIAPKMDTKKMADIRKELTKASADGIMSDYNSFLKREYPVEINEKVFNRVFPK